MKINLCAFILVLLLSSMAFAQEEIIARGENAPIAQSSIYAGSCDFIHFGKFTE